MASYYLLLVNTLHGCPTGYRLLTTKNTVLPKSMLFSNKPQGNLSLGYFSNLLFNPTHSIYQSLCSSLFQSSMGFVECHPLMVDFAWHVSLTLENVVEYGGTLIHALQDIEQADYIFCADMSDPLLCEWVHPGDAILTRIYHWPAFQSNRLLSRPCPHVVRLFLPYIHRNY